MRGDGEKKDKRIKRLKGYLLYEAEKFKVALLRSTLNFQSIFRG